MPRNGERRPPTAVVPHHGVIDTDREKYQSVFTILPFACGVHFPLQRAALHRGLGQNDHDLVVGPNRFFNRFLETVPNFQILWSEPAPHSFGQQIRMKHEWPILFQRGDFPPDMSLSSPLQGYQLDWIDELQVKEVENYGTS